MNNLPVVGISGVLNLADGAVRLSQGVVSVHGVTVAALVLGLVVTGVGVSHGVSVVVFGVSLNDKNIPLIILNSLK